MLVVLGGGGATVKNGTPGVNCSRQLTQSFRVNHIGLSDSDYFNYKGKLDKECYFKIDMGSDVLILNRKLVKG